MRTTTRSPTSRPARHPAGGLGRTDLRRCGVIARVLDYATETRSFLVLFADEPEAVSLPEDVVLGAAAGLVADFFIAGNGATGHSSGHLAGEL
jgi:hypothetical protein